MAAVPLLVSVALAAHAVGTTALTGNKHPCQAGGTWIDQKVLIWSVGYPD